MRPIASIFFLLLTVGVALTPVSLNIFKKRQHRSRVSRAAAAEGDTAPVTWAYYFSIDGTLQEAGQMSASTSPYWWVNSGGQLWLRGGKGQTVQGELPSDNKWRLAYNRSNPVDTDNGYHPQNIFRLITRGQWQNFRQEVYTKINKLNLSASPNRNASNGILLFNRYLDGNNLYYTGIRVDGAAVIKKKIGGRYYTMAYKKVFSAPTAYHRDLNPNLLTTNQWLGLRSEVVNNPDGTVTVRLLLDLAQTGNFLPVLEARDSGQYGGPAITSGGYAGIRTDFMDVEFDNYRATRL